MQCQNDFNDPLSRVINSLTTNVITPYQDFIELSVRLSDNLLGVNDNFNLELVSLICYRLREHLICV